MTVIDDDLKSRAVQCFAHLRDEICAAFEACEDDVGGGAGCVDADSRGDRVHRGKGAGRLCGPSALSVRSGDSS